MATTTHQVIIAIGIALYEILIVSLLDSCAPPSASINSFENRVMVDLEVYKTNKYLYIKRANNSIRDEKILLKFMIEHINSLYFNPKLKEIARLSKNSKINPITTPYKICKITKNHKKSDPKSMFNMDMDPNICLDMLTCEVDAQVSHIEAVRASSMPVLARVRGITIYFKMGSEINLSKGQEEMFAYIFYSDVLPSENIVKIGGSSVTHQELFARVRIIQLLISITLKITWCLPPSFSVLDIFQYLQIEELIDRYASDYIKKYPSLQCIYIPIEDKDHWYLMVMSLELKTIFHVDSNLPTERKEPRTESTNTLAVVLSRIISLAHFEICPFKHGDFSGGWSSQTVEVVHDVQPPPTCKKDSSLWVLS
ncbi:Ulp1 protease family, carboxy-terminal domain protein [Arachis hypogaea]|nr:Ulp1 protease family, carboxy-terminal domain protein [Arachis hypogaea]